MYRLEWKGKIQKEKAGGSSGTSGKNDEITKTMRIDS